MLGLSGNMAKVLFLLVHSVSPALVNAAVRC